MTGILDTHAFVWCDSEPSKLSPMAAAFIQDPGNRLFVSVASAWEIVIKSQLGKLVLRSPLPSIVADQQNNGIELLRIEFTHVLEVERLPAIHRDPFDRMLVAQAIHEGAVIVSADPQISKYPVTVVW